MAAFFRLIDPHGNEYQHVQDHSLQLALKELDQQIEVINQQERQLAFRKQAIEDARQEVLQQIQHRKFREYLHEREQEARLQEYYLEQLRERRAFEQVVRTIVQGRFEDDETQRNIRREKEARRLLRRILVSDPSNTQLIVPNDFHQFFINHPVVERLYSSEEDPSTTTPENTEYPQRSFPEPVQNDSPITRASNTPSGKPEEIYIQIQQPIKDEGPRVAEIPLSHEKAPKRSQQSLSDEDLTRTELSELNEYLLGAQRRLNKRGNARKHYDSSQAAPANSAFEKMTRAALNPDPEVIEPEETSTQTRNPLETLLSSGHYSIVNSDDESGPPEYEPTSAVPIDKENAGSKAEQTATSEAQDPNKIHPENTTSIPNDISTKSATNVKEAALSSNQPSDEKNNTTSTSPVSQSSVRHNVTVEEVPDEDA
ncbi:hypothetical protein SPOG_02105 [Schizosaccharomyces cryophilus OY26]|uniref:Uncharacterized protein n=1 Tax=Schizosaccharomyces cryophilus (strain OY26 / ATCC MYA-4695 / CBS 11777 / NBRC 106824 / NRRL Y48691) TaxID=653667 RepID=S9XGG9_SCHCR|nr:uncharacterized protein SPOG_02105 [Schizosaccharomyces cryophilus OY26]EPY52786.1 hypothetical protein SPOG_02105 [Schizosaccharomyces cryophilus OY26]